MTHAQKINKIIGLIKSNSRRKVYYKRYEDSPVWWYIETNKVKTSHHNSKQMKLLLHDAKNIRFSKPRNIECKMLSVVCDINYN